MFYKFCFLIDGRISFFLHYHPTHHPFSPVLNRQARALSGAGRPFPFLHSIFRFFLPCPQCIPRLCRPVQQHTGSRIHNKRTAHIRYGVLF